MKKALLTIIAAISLLAFAIGFTACTPNGGQTNAGGNKFDGITSTKGVYGFSAASAGTLISSMNGGSAQTLAKAKGLSLRTQNTVTDEETIATLNDYMMLVESLLSDGAFGMTESESDRPEYDTKADVTYTDMLGNTLSYTMYYKQTPHEDNEKGETDTNINVADDNIVGETEEEYDIAGILIIDNIEYPMHGEREIEKEAGETESETKFTVELNETQKMIVKQSIETEGSENEQEYSYSLIENGNLKERSTFEYEQEDDETEVKFSLTKDGQTQIFYFEKEFDKGEEFIKIRVGDKNSTQTYRVHIETDADGNSRYVYEFAGKQTSMDRHDQDDD